MVIQDVKALFHHLPELGFFRQVGTNLFTQMVMGRNQVHHFTLFPDGDMAVAGAGVEGKFLIVECFPDGIHQNIRIFGGDFAG